jgi:hypothetical protein
MSEIKQTPGIEFINIVKDGFKSMTESDCDGFEYIVGKVKGGSVKIVFEPDDSDVTDSVVIDGVDGYGYCLLFEE